MLRRALAAAGATAAGVAGWSLFESQWVELREVEALVPELPPELDGLTILHLSDFHLGTISFNGRTLERAVRWASERPSDIVAVTGDLLSRRRGEAQLQKAVAALRPRLGAFAVLGNHDVEVTRDPFSQATDASVVENAGAVLLENTAVLHERNGKTVQIVGGDQSLGPYWGRLADLADPEADLRVLLFHFPDIVRYLPPGAFDLVLAGHLHGGQICIPTPRGKVRLEHLQAEHWEGLHETPAGLLHVSRGLGTSFVPFRFLARPEATRLVLRSAPRSMPTRLHPVTAASIAHAPPPCVGCVFWQSRPERAAAKGKWAERMEDDWGPWGTLYYDDGERLLGFIQYGPAGHFPRADELPAGPPSDDAVLITCAYLVDPNAPWAIQSLFLAVIGEARDRKAKAIETFAYRYPEGESAYERFLVHRTIFPSDFLADLGFYPVRWDGEVALARLELGGLQPVAEGSTALLWRKVKEVLTPAPVPQRP